MNLQVATDFSGIGVPEMALEALNVPCDHVFACEKDKFARQSFLANFKPIVFYEDITQRNHVEVGPVDMYMAGFPCQPFSEIGKRKGFDDVRGTLFFDLANFIKTNRPEAFILENVRGLLIHDKPKNSKTIYGNTFNTIINLLAKTVNGQLSLPFYTDNLGYHVYYKVLNSKHYGVPQNRERIFIIGFRDDDHTFSFPKGTPLKTLLKDVLEEKVDDNLYLSEKAIKSLSIRNLDTPFRVPRINPEIAGCLGTKNNSNNYQFNSDTSLISTNNDYVMAASRGRGKNWKQQLEIRTDGLTNSLTTVEKDNILISNACIRRLTPLECFRLQGIPDEMYQNCKNAGLSDTQLYKQAGNAMTRSVMMALIEKILPNFKR